jgi:hypothetical protein
MIAGNHYSASSIIHDKPNNFRHLILFLNPPTINF